MNRTLKLAAPLIALVAVFSLVAGTQAANNGVTLDGVKLGTHVHGPELKEAKALEGKVVVFEYWGDRCPPCIRAIPHLKKVQAKYGRDKLNIVANQVWTKDVDAAKKAWKNAGGGDDITVVNHGALKGANVRGVPHSFIFDHTGKLLWNGHPMDKKFDKTIEQAINALPKQS